MSHRIERVTLHRFDVSHRTQWRNVELLTSEGLVGTGECSDIRPKEVGEPTLGTLLPIISDMAVDEDIWDLDRRLTHSLGHAEPNVRFGKRMVIGAVVGALCDIHAQMANRPLADWLGGAPKPAVEL